jgi:hypothetical protein
VTQTTRMQGAEMVSIFFKILAWVVIGAGVVAAIVVAQHDSSVGAGGASTLRDVLVTAVVGLFAGASLAFFAYVLDLLMALVGQGGGVAPSGQTAASVSPTPLPSTDGDPAVFAAADGG